VEGLESPLVGREAEYQTLLHALERLQVGEGGIANIVGEAGLGKSRLVAELRKETSTMDINWVEGRCLSYGGTIPYLLWLDVLREILGVKVEDSPEEVREKLQDRIKDLIPDQYETLYPYLGHLLSLPLEDDLQEWVEDQDGEQFRSGTFEAVEWFIRGVTKEHPLVLVCEDLHWADPTSIQMLERIFQLTERDNILILCVFRPEKDHLCWGLREVAFEQYPDRYTDLQISPLSDTESGDLVGNLVGIEGIPDDLKARILGHAEGNPFYVEEILRSLIDSGHLVLDERINHWAATSDLEAIAIPDTLHGVLLARIDRLQRDTKRVLQMASVIGRIFLYRVLKAIAEEERDLDGHLQDLQVEEMIRERMRIPELEYIFKHHLTQEAAYNGLLKRERRTFHRQVAEVLEGLFPDRVEENLGLLAYHWEQAEDPEKATEFLLRAGDKSRLAFAHQEAVDYYHRARTIYEEQVEFELASRVLLQLGLTYHSAFDFQNSQQSYERAFELMKDVGETRATEIPPAPHAFRIIANEPITLDPQLFTDEDSALFIFQLFSGLVETSSNMSIVPDVAKRWELLDGGMRYVFHLRDDVYWTDGKHVTAHDFEFAWKRLFHPERDLGSMTLSYDIKNTRAYHQGEFQDADKVGVRALDEFTLEVELERPIYHFLHSLAFLRMGPVPRHVVEEYGDDWSSWEHIVTNGPFKLASRNPNVSLTFERNPSYHGPFKGNLETVHITVETSLNKTPFEYYKEDLVDFIWLGRVPVQDWESVRHRYAKDFITCLSSFAVFIGFDSSRKPFDDVRVRQALAMAVDKEEIAHEILNGFYSPATGGFIPLGYPGHNGDIGVQYRPDEARKLLSEAGYPGGLRFPDVELHVINGHGLVASAKYMQSKWLENLGVNVVVRPVEVDWFMSNPTPHFSIIGDGPMSPDPGFFLDLARKYNKWQDNDFDRLLSSISDSTDHIERITLCQSADEILMLKLPRIPILYWRMHMLVKPWVKGYSMYRLVQWIWKDVILEPH
jgi:ABC-type oligopeptide transport system substrate-binding subunit